MIRLLILAPFTYYGKYLLTGESLYLNPKDEKQFKQLNDLCSVNSDYRQYLAIFDETGEHKELIDSFMQPYTTDSTTTVQGVNYVEEIKKNTSAKVDDVQRLENYLTPPQEAKENYYIAQTLSEVGVHATEEEVESETSPNIMFFDNNKEEPTTSESKKELATDVKTEIEILQKEITEVCEVIEQQEPVVYKWDQLKEMPYSEVKEIAESMGLDYTTKSGTINAILNKQKEK